MAKITPEIAERIMRMAPTMSNRMIAEELTNAGVAVSHVAVGKFIKEQRIERAETTRAIVQDKLKTAVPADLDVLGEMQTQLLVWFRDGTLRVSERLMVADRLERVTKDRLGFAGAGIGGGDDASEQKILSRDEVLQKAREMGLMP